MNASRKQLSEGKRKAGATGLADGQQRDGAAIVDALLQENLGHGDSRLNLGSGQQARHEPTHTISNALTDIRAPGRGQKGPVQHAPGATKQPTVLDWEAAQVATKRKLPQQDQFGIMGLDDDMDQVSANTTGKGKGSSEGKAGRQREDKSQASGDKRGGDPDPQKIQYKSRTTTHALTYDDSKSEDPDDEAEQLARQELLKEANKTEIDKLKSDHQSQLKKLEQIKEAIEEQQKKELLGKNLSVEVTHNERFKNFSDMFSTLTKQHQVLTFYPMVSCIISYDSKSTVTVTKKNETEYYVRQFLLGGSYDNIFEECIGGDKALLKAPKNSNAKSPLDYQDDPDGDKEHYIKLKEIEQNADGTKFAFVYFDDGKFRLRTFDSYYYKITKNGVTDLREKKKRTPEEIAENELNINAELALDESTMAIDNFEDPFINCCFVDNKHIYVNLFHTQTFTVHHFVYNQETKAIGRRAPVKLPKNDQNFPYKCFYNNDNNEVYQFYRQGQSFRVPIFELEGHPANRGKIDGEVYQETITDRCLGQMFMIDETALISRSSDQTLFFKLVYDEVTKEDNWVNYFTLPVSGQIYFIKGNQRCQITTNDEIHFYLIDFKTYIPALENVMQNFMQCSQMMFGRKKKYCITYKEHQKSFDVYTRKYEHNFKATIVEGNCARSRGLLIPSMNAFLVSYGATIKFYDIDRFQEFVESKIEIPVLKVTTVQRQPNQVINMQVSSNAEYLAVISGCQMIRMQQKPNQLFIFKRQRTYKENELDKFQLIKQLDIRKLFDKEFVKASLSFYFKHPVKGSKIDRLIFADRYKIFELNFETDQVYTTVTFMTPLANQPTIFKMNADQTTSIVAGPLDCTFYDHKTNEQIDLDHLFNAQAIKEIEYDHEDKVFYMLFNNYQERFGLYIVRFQEDDPTKKKFILVVRNKLQIDDADVVVARDEENKYKELVVTYKTIYVNTYNMQVIDLMTEEQWTIYKHDSTQLWESKIYGFYSQKTQDYITINSQGINITSLGGDRKREFTSKDGDEKLLHSFESMNYLKVDGKNFLNFEFAGEQKVISVVQQYNKYDDTGSETAYEDVYKIKIHDITLRQLLLFHSIYVSKSQGDILRLVQAQPKPGIFYHSLLEFDGANMVSMLSFDSKSIKELLNDRNKEHFQSEYPIFYKNQIQKNNNKKKFYYRSAIGSAIRYNQVRAVEYMMKYIEKYQNTYVSFFLFNDDFETLLDKGLEVNGILSSHIFCHPIDYDEWPSTHTNNTDMVEPYNLSIFDLRGHYREIFKLKEPSAQEATKGDKVYKISYSLNMLPSLGEYVTIGPDGEKSIENPGVSVMQMFTQSAQQGGDSQLEIFEIDNFQVLTGYRWDTFARGYQMIGFVFHLYYVVVLLVYVNMIYINNDKKHQKLMGKLIVSAISQPVAYKLNQLFAIGAKAYFSDLGNWLGIIYILGSIANAVLQNYTDPLSYQAKFLMIIVLLMQIPFTFFYLKIFASFSKIFTMLKDVIRDLKVFLFFFIILIVLLSMTFAVLGLGNEKFEGKFQEYYNAKMLEGADGKVVIYHGSEYRTIGKFMGYVITLLRISLGDFVFESSQFLGVQENFMFWIMWMFMVIITCIIFLNFIIAETSKSYTEVDERSAATIAMERALLCAEAETALPNVLKGQKWFPKYLVIRQIET